MFSNKLKAELQFRIDIEITLRPYTVTSQDPRSSLFVHNNKHLYLLVAVHRFRVTAFCFLVHKTLKISTSDAISKDYHFVFQGKSFT